MKKNYFTIDIQRQCGLWKKQKNLTKPFVKKFFLEALKVIKPPLLERAGLEVSILLTDDAFIQHLNKQYRQQDKPTNVLAFPLHSPTTLQAGSLSSLVLGDIVLAYETIEREALEQQKIFIHHFSHLVVHGFLHLWGFDHQDEEEAEKMEQLEIQILSEFTIPNPYKNML